MEYYIDEKKKNCEIEYRNLRNLKKGEYIGLYSFFTGMKENVQTRTKDFCKFLSISRSDFLDLL